MTLSSIFDDDNYCCAKICDYVDRWSELCYISDLIKWCSQMMTSSVHKWPFWKLSYFCMKFSNTSINDVVGWNWWQMTSVTCSHMTIVGYLSYFCLKFTNTVFHKWCHHEIFFTKYVICICLLTRGPTLSRKNFNARY